MFPSMPVPSVSDSAAACSVAVRTLCDFTARQGDLDLRFTPAPSALEGMLGHAAVRARRGALYQSEISLSGQYRSLTVRGRADGYDPQRNQLEEIKTHRSDLDRLPDNQRQLHWAQARVYGWLLCEKLGLTEIRIALVYFNIVSQKETVLLELHSAHSLRAAFEDQCQRYLYWAGQESAHRAARDRALAALDFPHDGFRPGQRLLAEAVYKAAVSRRPLLAQAPTGIGKTIGTIFPMLKAMPGQQIDKLFCLSAKTSGRALALDSLQRVKLHAAGLPLRVLELVARDKACEHPDKACHGESCPLARGFYDRLPAARRDAAAAGDMTQASLREIARTHEICPYYLGQEMALWSDAVVGDYNYFFDLHAMLHAMTLNADWRVGVLVDEAHNLVERGRKMYSAELDPVGFRMARREAPPAVKKTLDRVARQWSQLSRESVEDYAVRNLPDKLLLALQQAVSVITDLLGEQPAALGAELQRFYFDAMHFTRVADFFDDHSLFDVSRQPAARQERSVLCIRNLVPAPFLRARLEAAHASVLFSATLSPWHFYADMLGLPDCAAWVDIPPAFRPEQLQVRIVSDVSTRYADRDASLAPIARLIGQQFARVPGNYLAFFSSFDYLQNALAAFREQYPDIPVWEQSRKMDETARARFLARFEPEGSGVGFAVLGGVFAEGVDLPGKRLVGAFIATLGLPQVNPVNEQIAARMHQKFGAGYDYTYFFPGLQKVVQAAGRVIRSETDSGVLYLIDDRYARPDARALYPPWWQPRIIRSTERET
ncbi:ATP-dependent DNA helicase [Lacisediminimonas profundi]|uniref:ATP-dependent DNA helicase n=1 Tax=Lacisediminimonas profundi TaxID=2603856 RepID=UPI001F4F688F|nr:ATP-dependent DNA helicase [Lacisediminimonas profundi]